MQILHARYGLVASSRVGTDGNVHLHTVVVDGGNSNELVNGGIPSGYGSEARRQYGNVDEQTDTLMPLKTNITREELERARNKIHQHLWAGGSLTYHDVYRVMVELVLCRYHD